VNSTFLVSVFGGIKDPGRQIKRISQGEPFTCVTALSCLQIESFSESCAFEDGRNLDSLCRRTRRAHFDLGRQTAPPGRRRPFPFGLPSSLPSGLDFVPTVLVLDKEYTVLCEFNVSRTPPYVSLGGIGTGIQE